MKKTMLTSIKIEKIKWMRKRMHRHGALNVKDPKDLRGVEGALLKSAISVALEDEPSSADATEQRHPLVSISNDW